jgi:putative copper export protein
VGATLWVGGLVSLLMVLPVFWGTDNSGEDALLPRLVARFSRFALIASAMVVLSGVLQAALEVGSWSGFVETIYGQMVLVKIFLLCDMLVLASFNTWRGRRRYPAGGAPASALRLFRRGVRAELGLGVLVLVVAAVLTGTPPDRTSTLPTTAVSQPPTAEQRVATP